VCRITCMTGISCKHIMILASLGGAVSNPVGAAVIQFLGDFYLPAHVMEKVDGNADVLQGIEMELEQGDFNIVNLEGVITETNNRFSFKDHYLKMPFAAAGVLRRSRIHAVNLANNHTMDYGLFGLFDTVAELTAHNIHHVGAGDNIDEAVEPLSVRIKERKICFLAFSRTLPERFWAGDERPGVANLAYEEFQREVADCAAKHDETFVSFHWGEEESKNRKDYQAELARLAIDAGATGVVGHHPHVLQEVELYKHGFIVYSVGNSAFGTYPVESQPEGMLARVVIGPGGKVLQLVGLEVDNRIVQFIPQRQNSRFKVDFEGEAATRCRWQERHRLWECPL
jgi:poly-gamma-glutamate capsule biosynthesis protein CapA/YwtB (metallophosphatase superfamily)